MDLKDREAFEKARQLMAIWDASFFTQVAALLILGESISMKEHKQHAVSEDALSAERQKERAKQRLLANESELERARSRKCSLSTEKIFEEQIKKDKELLLRNQRYVILFKTEAQALETELSGLRKQYNIQHERLAKYFIESVNQISVCPNSSSTNENKSYTP